MADIGRFLIGLGVVLIVIGGLLVLSSALGLRVPFGRLPGDVHVQRGNWSFYFPITTSIVLSLVLTLIFWVLSRR
jgi:ribose/xylose/arabinose/galactoside ABC-type transport system permease subunit